MIRLAGALLRGLLVVAVIALPALLLPGVSRNSLEISVIFGAMAAAFTLFEYGARQPGLVDFRYAPPYNRGRFVTLAALLVALVFLVRADGGQAGFGPGYLAFADRVGGFLDFPFSPVRLATSVLAAGREAEFALLVHRLAAVAVMISVAGILFFTLLLWLFRWPQGREKFNLWVNLPTFVPSTGRDVERRLLWGGRLNVLIGLSLPLTLVVLSSRAIGWLDPQALTSRLTLVWVVALWAFLPASFILRGMALMKVGWLVKRARRF